MRHTQTFALRLPNALFDWLATEAERRRTTVAQVVRDAIEHARADAADAERIAALEARLEARLHATVQGAVDAIGRGMSATLEAAVPVIAGEVWKRQPRPAWVPAGQPQTLRR